MPRKFVITGGPCSGKTSIINHFENKFIVFHEVARRILEKNENSLNSQYEIFKEQVEQNLTAENFKEIVFFDRGIPDSLSYYIHHKWKIPEDVLNECKPERTGYELVFFLERLPFEKDGLRIESGDEEAKKISGIIYETYKEMGYKVISVPVMSVKKRAEFVLLKLQDNKT